MKLYSDDKKNPQSSVILWADESRKEPVFFVYGWTRKDAWADAVALKDLWEGLSIAVVFADWLEERGHKAAADDLRRNF